jgi:hypothetical protein
MNLFRTVVREGGEPVDLNKMHFYLARFPPTRE